MNLLKDLTENEFVLTLITEDQYMEQLIEIVKAVEKTHTKICYVCLNKPYEDSLKDLENKDVDTSRFFFIDVLTSHYKEPKPVDNCMFLSSPSDLNELRIAIKQAMQNGCSAIVLDTISTLLIYQEVSSIVKFTHSILTEGKKDVKKLFIVLKEEPTSEGNMTLINDLNMFADKQIEVNKTS